MPKPKIRWESLKLPILFGAAVGATAVTFLVVALVAAPSSYVYQLMFHRSWIQYATCLCFWVTMGVLVEKHLAWVCEKRALAEADRILEQPQFSSTLTWTDADVARRAFEDGAHGAFRDSLTFRSIENGLDRLRKSQSTQALDDYFRARSEADRSQLETSYTGVRYLVWLIPTLGFLGTVMGIGRGIAGFASALMAAQDFAGIKAHLPDITQKLGTAFDTTLLALLLSAIAVFYLSYMIKREEETLERIDDLCLDGVSALFQEHSGASDELIAALAENVRRLQENMNGNRAAIEHCVREELPGLLVDQLGRQMKELADRLAEHADRIAEATSGARVVEAVRQVGREGREALAGLGGLLAGAEEMRQALLNLAGALGELRDLRGVKEALDRNNQLLERLAGDLERLEASARASEDQARAMADVAGRVSEAVAPLSRLAEALGTVEVALAEARRLLEDEGPRLRAVLAENAATIDRASKMLARSHEGSADVLSAVTKLINRMDGREGLTT